jgi:hypothetical protein
MIDHGLVIRHRLSVGRVGVMPAHAAGDRVFVDVETTVGFLRFASPPGSADRFTEETPRLDRTGRQRAGIGVVPVYGVWPGRVRRFVVPPGTPRS